MGIHAHAGEKDEQGRGTVLDCRKCHGENQHRILPANDSLRAGLRQPSDRDLRQVSRRAAGQLRQYLARSRPVPVGALGHGDAAPVATAPTACFWRATIARRCTVPTWRPPAASAIASSPNGSARAFTAKAAGRAEWRQSRRRAGSLCGSRVAPPVIKGTRSVWPPRRGFAKECPIFAAIAMPSYRAAMP